jgi:hypothetical protein
LFLSSGVALQFPAFAGFLDTLRESVRHGCDMGMHWEQLVDRRFVIQKISEHGTSNPIVARLTIQTFNLLEWLDCDAQRKEDLIGAYLELNRRLLQCFDHQQRLVVARAKTVEATQGVLEKGNYSVPFVIGLQEEAEGFLLQRRTISESWRAL